MTAVPDDATLTHRGLESETGQGRVLVIACGALAREIIALRDTNRWTHLTLTCLPAILHNRPERIAPAVEDVLRARQAGFDDVLVVYGDCGTGGALQVVCDRFGARMIAGPHCYAFYEGTTRFAEHADEISAFYLTDFLVRQFDAFVWRPLGLDRHPDLRDAYFAHYETLVYLAQTDEPALDTKARACADRLGLAYERRLTGFGDLPAFLAPRAAD
ncbi:MAG: DUF1638 domain-containing protein [Rhodobacteraceae bacterium]|nr:DUF1638 domain-containing protein [Paracoccaceae bacterium]